MKGVEKIEKTYPNMTWTGGSSIHRSICRGVRVEMPNSEGHNEEDFKKVLVGSKAIHHLCDIFLKNLDWGEDTVWIMTEREMRRLLTYLALYYEEKRVTAPMPGNFKNPDTGNFFVPLFTNDSLLGGIRVFIENELFYEENKIFDVYFRIRVVDTEVEGAEGFEGRQTINQLLEEIDVLAQTDPLLNTISQEDYLDSPLLEGEEEKIRITEIL